MNQEERFLQIIREQVEGITEAKLNAARKEKSSSREPLFEVVIRLGILSRADSTRFWAEATGYKYIDLHPDIIEEEAANLIPKSLAEKHRLIPFRLSRGDTIQVAIYNAADVVATDMLRRVTKKKIDVYLADLEKLNDCIGLFYGETASLDEDIEKNIAAAISGTIAEGATQPPYVMLVDLFIKKAVVDRATDIHISPGEQATRISYRVDGIMRPAHVLPIQLHAGLVTRIKVMSGLNIAEQRLPQGGAINFEYSGRYIDIRTSTSPTGYGENVVLRLLDKANIVMGLDKLGLSPEDNEKVVELSLKPHGIVLSAGPTGSGKTTTLYSILQQIDALERNVLTVEDPIEYRLAYIKQTQVNNKAGLTFASAIRTFLRQDPDVILVGEIRDLETAKIAFRAAMTGHLVLSTIHTNDSAACIARLMDLGIESYLIPSCLRAVIAQRLVRRVCKQCREEHVFTEHEIKRYDLVQAGLSSELRGKGCRYCGNTGYKGRIAIYEILPITTSISELILRKVSSDQIMARARKDGMRTMQEDGIEKVRQGITTVEEVFRVTG